MCFAWSHHNRNILLNLVRSHSVQIMKIYIYLSIVSIGFMHEHLIPVECNKEVLLDLLDKSLYLKRDKHIHISKIQK